MPRDDEVLIERITGILYPELRLWPIRDRGQALMHMRPRIIDVLTEVRKYEALARMTPEQIKEFG